MERYTMKDWPGCVYTITDLEYYKTLLLIEQSEPKGPGLPPVDMEEIRRMQEEIERDEISLCRQNSDQGLQAPGTFFQNFSGENFLGFQADGTLREIFPSRNTSGSA
jgi:hypothetical protein